jgi:hypothetical protein
VTGRVNQDSDHAAGRRGSDTERRISVIVATRQV